MHAIKSFAGIVNYISMLNSGRWGGVGQQGQSNEIMKPSLKFRSKQRKFRLDV
jgi:hypothetical protein